MVNTTPSLALLASITPRRLAFQGSESSFTGLFSSSLSLSLSLFLFGRFGRLIISCPALHRKALASLGDLAVWVSFFLHTFKLLSSNHRGARGGGVRCLSRSHFQSIYKILAHLFSLNNFVQDQEPRTNCQAFSNRIRPPRRLVNQAPVRGTLIIQSKQNTAYS